MDKFIEQDINNLTDKVKPNVKRDLQRFSDQAKKYLEVELAKKLFFEKGQTLALLNDDETLDSALQILSDSTKYQSILQK